MLCSKVDPIGWAVHQPYTLLLVNNSDYLILTYIFLLVHKIIFRSSSETIRKPT